MMMKLEAKKIECKKKGNKGLAMELAHNSPTPRDVRTSKDRMPKSERVRELTSSVTPAGHRQSLPTDSRMSSPDLLGAVAVNTSQGSNSVSLRSKVNDKGKERADGWTRRESDVEESSKDKGEPLSTASNSWGTQSAPASSAKSFHTGPRVTSSKVRGKAKSRPIAVAEGVQPQDMNEVGNHTATEEQGDATKQQQSTTNVHNTWREAGSGKHNDRKGNATNG
jgi:hypothetical protein